MKTRIPVIALFLCLFAASAFAGPFGLERGMTKQHIIDLVGHGQVIEDKGPILRVHTVPRSHPEFESYTLFISPTQGLLKINAIGKDVATSGDGEEIKDDFSKIHAALVTAYGPARDDLHNLKSGSLWDKPEDFMMGIVQKDRFETAFWFPVGRPDKITSIAEDLLATSSSSGYLVVGYEFEGWTDFADELTNKQDSVL
jgi:hypothetical protein